MKKKGIVYKVTNKNNNKVYIGITTYGLSHRKWVHLNCKNNNYYFQKALRKEPDCFIWEIIEDDIIDKKDLIEKEKFWISYYSSNKDNFGYNLTEGGEGFNLINPKVMEQKGKKIKETIRVKKENGSYKTTKELFFIKHGENAQKLWDDIQSEKGKKITKSKLGFKFSDESKLKMSNSHKGQTPTKESIRKRSEKGLVRYQLPEEKKDQIIKLYKDRVSLRKMEIITNIPRSRISRNLKRWGYIIKTKRESL